MPEEQFDICDENDNVIGQAARSVVHAENLLHRAVHIWVFNSRGELMIHLRSQWKDQFPLIYTSSASGHVDAGETYEVAAIRELREELQLTGTLEFLTKLPASPATAYEHTVLFRLTSDETPTPDPAEIQSIHYERPEKIWQMLQESPEQFTPPFQQLMHWWHSVQITGHSS